MSCGCCYHTKRYYTQLMEIADAGFIHDDWKYFHYYCPTFGETYKKWRDSKEGKLSDYISCTKEEGEMPPNPWSHHYFRNRSYCFTEEPSDYYDIWEYEQRCKPRHRKHKNVAN